MERAGVVCVHGDGEVAARDAVAVVAAEGERRLGFVSVGGAGCVGPGVRGDLAGVYEVAEVGRDRVVEGGEVGSVIKISQVAFNNSSVLPCLDSISNAVSQEKLFKKGSQRAVRIFLDGYKLTETRVTLVLIDLTFAIRRLSLWNVSGVGEIGKTNDVFFGRVFFHQRQLVTFGAYGKVLDALLTICGEVVMLQKGGHTFGEAIIIVVQLKHMVKAFHNHLSITALDVSIVEESNHHRQDFGRRRAWNYFG